MHKLFTVSKVVLLYETITVNHGISKYMDNNINGMGGHITRFPKNVTNLFNTKILLSNCVNAIFNHKFYNY